MQEFTESDAIDCVNEIGQAFANDVNDGDGPTVYAGFSMFRGDDGSRYLEFCATLEDESVVVFTWRGILIGAERNV